MRSLKNNVQLIGNMGADPEFSKTKTDTKMVSFSLATNHNYKDSQGNKVEETQWHSIVAFNKTAELIHTFGNKGRQIAVSGPLKYREYKDKDGIDHRVAEIIADSVLFMNDGKKGESESSEE